ncbi:MAG: DUF2231 domain-containing protein [Terriglobales bacterium]
MNPFDPKSVLLAKHAQHVVLIHFPIALFIAGATFDLLAAWKQSRELATAVYYNLTAAAISTVPAAATGVLAWQWQLEGKRLKGVLLLHMIFGLASTAMIWLVWWLHFRTRRNPEGHLPAYRLPIELLGLPLVALTGHLGGFLSGVNSPG